VMIEYTRERKARSVIQRVLCGRATKFVNRGQKTEEAEMSPHIDAVLTYRFSHFLKDTEIVNANSSERLAKSNEDQNNRWSGLDVFEDKIIRRFLGRN
jgi:hypothetical protein